MFSMPLQNGISMSAYLRPSSVKNLHAEVIVLVGGLAIIVTVHLAEQDDGWSSGACGSLVIFNSSGETGWNPIAGRPGLPE